VQLEHTFTVPAGIDQAWQVLLDIERVAPCMPGASLDTVDGDNFTGTVKVRLGPIGLTYKGKASFVEKDEAAHRVVIDAQGKDARGNGTASAKITATLVADGDQATEVAVLTDLNITGKPAQFGRGVMVDVGNKLIGQFADCLAGKLGGTDVAPPPEAEAAPSGPVITVAGSEPIAQAAGVGSEPATQAAVAGSEPAQAGTEPTAQPAVAGQGTAPVGVPAALAGGSGPASAKASSPDSSPTESSSAASSPVESSAVEALPAVSPLDQPTPAAAEIAAGDKPGGEQVTEVPTNGQPAEQPVTDIAAGVQATADSSAPGTDPVAPTFTAPANEAAPGYRPTSASNRHAAPEHVAPEVEPIDLLSSAGPAIVKRLAPAVIALLAIILFVIARRRGR
jgi:carbon monoxide dehydrogenase subunit G